MVLITFQITVIYLAAATSSKYAAQRNISAVYNYVFLGNHSFSPFYTHRVAIIRANG